MTQQVTPTAIEFANGPDSNDIFPITDQAAHTNGNGVKDSNGDPSPLTDTPSDTSAAEEQTFSASDYIFVSYPLLNERCGGDTNSCECGDDCDCLGCSMHQPVLSPEAVVDEQSPLLDGDVPNSMGDATDDEMISNGLEKEPAKSCCG
jgi:hypothetical protein